MSVHKPELQEGTQNHATLPTAPTASPSEIHPPVSYPPPPKRVRPKHYARLLPPVPPLVRVQLGLLQDPVTEGSDDLQHWSVAQLLRTYIDQQTLEQRVLLRFNDGVCRELVAGSVQFPNHTNQEYVTTSSRTENPNEENAPLVFPNADEGRPSSRSNTCSSGEELESSSHSEPEGLSSKDSEATESDNTQSAAYEERHLGRPDLRGRLRTHSQSSDSERTTSDNPCDTVSGARFNDHRILKSQPLRAVKGSASTRGRERGLRGGRRGQPP